MKARISSAALQQIASDAAASRHAEICGLLFGDGDLIVSAQACANVAPDPSRSFEVDPGRLIAAHKAMRNGGPRVIGCYHSHPFGPSAPSARDAAAAGPDGWFWAIAAGHEIGLYRAVAGGPLHGRFEPVAFEIVPPGCARDPASPEGMPIGCVQGESSR